MAENIPAGQEEHVLLGGAKLGVKNYTQLRGTVVYVIDFLSKFLKRYDNDRLEDQKARSRDANTLRGEISDSEKASKDYAKGESDAALQRAKTYSDGLADDVKADLRGEMDSFESDVNSDVAGIRKDVAEKHDAIDKLVDAHRADTESFKEGQRKKDDERERRVTSYLDRATLADLQRHDAFETSYRAQLEDTTRRLALTEELLVRVGQALFEQTGNDDLLNYVNNSLREIRESEQTNPPVTTETPDTTETPENEDTPS